MGPLPSVWTPHGPDLTRIHARAHGGAERRFVLGTGHTAVGAVLSPGHAPQRPPPLAPQQEAQASHQQSPGTVPPLADVRLWAQ